MVRPSPELAKAVSGYVPVRITDMRKVDIDLLRFDFDLTLAILLMNADGTIYHRYGGRDHRGPSVWMSEGSLVRLLESTLREHQLYSKNPTPPPPPPRPKRTIMDLEPFARKVAKKDVDCVHCHMIHPAEREAAIEAKRFDPDDIWRWPSPERLGLELDPEFQTTIRAVRAGSPAEAAGLMAGDSIRAFDGGRVQTITDIQARLEGVPKDRTTIDVEFARVDEIDVATLRLPAGWRRGTPLDFSWRSSKWELRPMPGFGGRMLGADEKKALGLDAAKYASRVGYLVDWGEDAATGRNAKKAGLQKGDVLLSVAGVDDFQSEDHFQAWFRLTRKPGETVDLKILRGEERRTVTMTILP